MSTGTRSEEATREGPEKGSDSRTRRRADILAGYVDRLNAGEKPEAERLLREHPDLASELRQDLRMLSRICRALDRPSD